MSYVFAFLGGAASCIIVECAVGYYFSRKIG